MCSCKSVLVSFLCICLFSFSSNIYWLLNEDYFFIVCSSHPCFKLIVCKCVSIFLGPQFCSVNLCVYFCSSHDVLECILKSWSMIPPGFFGLFYLSISLAIWSLWWFNVNFKAFSCILWKILLEFWQQLHWICRLL